MVPRAGRGRGKERGGKGGKKKRAVICRMYRGLARDVIGHVIHRKPPSLGASGSSFVRDLVECALCFELHQEFWKGQDR